MAIVVFANKLIKEIKKTFNRIEKEKVISLLRSLEQNPKKGKKVGVVGNTVIKELNYNKFRFYFIANRFKIKFLSVEELTHLLLKFIRMSDKKQQEKTIKEIKVVLRELKKE